MIVEDGTGLIDAESLVDVSFADTYFDVRGKTLWTGSGKEYSLIAASEYVTNTYRFIGEPYSLVQALCFPRYIDGVFVDTPNAVKKAVCEVALLDLTKNELYMSTNQVLKRKKVGDIEKEYFEPSSSSISSISPFKKVDDMLRPFLVTSDTCRLNWE